MALTYFSCIIFSIIFLFNRPLTGAVPIGCTGTKCNGSPTIMPEWMSLCPFMEGSIVSNTSFLTSPGFQRAYMKYDKNAQTCDRIGCQESSHRLTCNRAFSQAGLEEVGVDSLFPFLSYNRQTPLAGKPKDQLAITSNNNKPRIAYVLLVHEGFNQTVRLLNAIYDRSNYYMIHVDFKAPKLKEALTKYADSFPNVYVLQQSFDIGWGGPEMVYSTLEGIFGLLDVSDKWDFVINLSSKDYPLCNNQELTSYLGTRLGKNFDVADVPPRDNEKYWRARAMYVYCNKIQCYQKKERAMPRGAETYVGSQWFIYSREFAQYLRSDSFPRLLMAHYEHTWIPDEGYFGTVLMNSPFNSTRIHHNLRYIVFDQIHPFYWTEADFPTLERQLDSCFARKFEENASVLNRIDTMRKTGRELRLP